MKRAILPCMIILCLGTVGAWAQWDYGFEFTKAGSAGLQFLKIGLGGRETAMGDAGLATVRGVNAIHWNPAGIAYVEKAEAGFTHRTWLLDIRLSAAAAAVSWRHVGVFGISVVHMGIPEFEETTVLAQDGTGRMVHAGDLAVGLALARRFTNKLSLGGQVRYVREELDRDSFSNVLLDFGAIYETGFRHLRLSVAAQHFGPDIKFLRDKFRMPLLFRIGLADDLFHTRANQLTVAVDLLHPTDNRERVNVGLEYGFMETLFVRGGYRGNSDLGAWSFGAGVRHELFGVAGSLDYSYADYGPIMGGVNTFSFTFGF
ncbi:MAG: PorV/PorQ family protein [candidate division KSB1 bacterium]|nr:PorV/PorQ family protein [candidate division KSB1 bacterium]